MTGSPNVHSHASRSRSWWSQNPNMLGRRGNEFDPCARGVVRVVRFDDIADGRAGAGDECLARLVEYDGAALRHAVANRALEGDAALNQDLHLGAVLRV